MVVAVLGPTASGKSLLADALAARLDGEIISADSMQVYRGMDIGTAKVPPERRSVPYHCLDLVSPEGEFNARTYQRLARAALQDIQARGRQAFVCGGTGLYVRALLDDFSFGALGESEETEETETAAQLARRAKRRERLAAEAESLGAAAFHAKLAERDPASAALIHPHNVRRVARAFEWLEEGGSYALHSAGFDRFHARYPTVFLGLDLPRELLYARINERVDEMMEQGFYDEVRALHGARGGLVGTAAQAIGYRELAEVLAGSATLSGAVARIKQATRRYAKRQLIWFKRDKRLQWLDARLPLDELLEQAVGIVVDPSVPNGLPEREALECEGARLSTEREH